VFLSYDNVASVAIADFTGITGREPCLLLSGLCLAYCFYIGVKVSMKLRPNACRKRGGGVTMSTAGEKFLQIKWIFKYIYMCQKNAHKLVTILWFHALIWHAVNCECGVRLL
jgi:hypothetical protein